MKQAVHDNINSFVGVSIDRSSEFYVIWKHCLRGTLSDVIKNNGKGTNPKFDRDFKGIMRFEICDCFLEFTKPISYKNKTE